MFSDQPPSVMRPQSVRPFIVSSSLSQMGTVPQTTTAASCAALPLTRSGERIEVLRSITLLTALCAAVTYVVPESLLPSKYLTAPLFLRAARDTLRIYEDYDLEHPNSSSLSIRLFLSSAIQTASGTHGVAFHILSEAGLIAMRMGLYHESALEGRDALEETLLRNAFWQLYVCDKTALVMKGRPVTIHETLFEGGAYHKGTFVKTCTTLRPWRGVKRCRVRRPSCRGVPRHLSAVVYGRPGHPRHGISL
ncbi:hypothetical protein FALCPG4_007794 [Fusarium falciforme]